MQGTGQEQTRNKQNVTRVLDCCSVSFQKEPDVVVVWKQEKKKRFKRHRKRKNMSLPPDSDLLELLWQKHKQAANCDRQETENRARAEYATIVARVDETRVAATKNVEARVQARILAVREETACATTAIFETTTENPKFFEDVCAAKAFSTPAVEEALDKAFFDQHREVEERVLKEMQQEHLDSIQDAIAAATEAAHKRASLSAYFECGDPTQRLLPIVEDARRTRKSALSACVKPRMEAALQAQKKKDENKNKVVVMITTIKVESKAKDVETKVEVDVKDKATEQPIAGQKRGRDSPAVTLALALSADAVVGADADAVTHV